MGHRWGSSPRSPVVPVTCAASGLHGGLIAVRAVVVLFVNLGSGVHATACKTPRSEVEEPRHSATCGSEPGLACSASSARRPGVWDFFSTGRTCSGSSCHRSGADQHSGRSCGPVAATAPQVTRVRWQPFVRLGPRFLVFALVGRQRHGVLRGAGRPDRRYRVRRDARSSDANSGRAACRSLRLWPEGVAHDDLYPWNLLRKGADRSPTYCSATERLPPRITQAYLGPGSPIAANTIVPNQPGARVETGLQA